MTVNQFEMLRNKNIDEIFDDDLIDKLYSHFTQDTNTKDLGGKVAFLNKYVNENYSNWIYRGIIDLHVETKYLVFLIYFLDRNPLLEREIINNLPEQINVLINETKKYFSLGC